MLSWREAELKFAEMMKNRGYDVVEVCKNENYYDPDIDYILTSPTTGLTKTFEVKCDTRIFRTKNLYLENWSRFGNGKGWWNCCQADMLVYCDSIKEKFYVFDMKKLRERVAQLRYRERRCGIDSVGQIVSLDELEGLYEEL